MTDQVKTEKGAASAAPAKDDRSGFVFYTFEKKSVSAILHHPSDGHTVVLEAKDGILALDLSNEDDWYISQYLAQPGKLAQYRARQVKSLADGASRKMTLGERIDELLSLSDKQLLAVVPKSKQKSVNTRGNMIAAIIQKEV